MTGRLRGREPVNGRKSAKGREPAKGMKMAKDREGQGGHSGKPAKGKDKEARI